jgi:hypothetical protein
MIAVVGLECIGDDATWREKRREAAGASDAATFRRALTSGRFGEMMRESLRYEGRPKAWVARITGRDPKHGLAREFLVGKRDYSDASDDGSRGVVRWFECPDGGVYEVNAPMSWTEADRYFARSERGVMVKLTAEEFAQWLEEQR